MHRGVMFWGWAKIADTNYQDLLDPQVLETLIAHRTDDVGVIEFVCGIWMPQIGSPKGSGWIAPCDPRLPHLMDTFLETWRSKD
jgi:hypothetical protein